MSKFRLFFTTDVHGSDVCFRKFLNAAKVYEASVLVLGGDITGKLLIPLVDEGQGRYRYQWLDRDVVTDAEGIVAAEREIRAAAAYSFRTDPEQLARIQADPRLAAEVFVVAMAGVAKQWVVLAEERLRGRDVECYIAPGNDDDFGIDEVLGNSDVVRNPEGQVIALRGAVEMITTGYSNPTPWDTPREEPEDALLARICAMGDRVRNLTTAVFTLHVPPYGSGLDEAPLLDNNLKPQVSGGRMMMGPVGSTAVREAIKRYQPSVALHGHIHESRAVVRIGRTRCINPGSEYGEGVLRGVLLELDEKKGLLDHVLIAA
jgi:Icc-related predicted phosphoesterase